MIILDTDTCVEILRGNRSVILRRERTDDSVGVSFMTVGELFYGAEKSTNPRKNLTLVERLVLSVTVLQSDVAILRRFGALKAATQREGAVLADADLLIAATTLEYGTRLITDNARHFERIPGLAVESWR